MQHFKSLDFCELSQKRRRAIRKCLDCLEIREIRDEKILIEQGYRVLKSALDRTRYIALPEENQFIKKCNAFLNTGDNSHIILGVFQDNRLLAFAETYAVENTAYFVTMMMETDALKYGTSSALYFLQFLLCKQSEKITEIFAGGATGGDVTLDAFKQRMGLSLVHIPFKCSLLKPAGWLLKCRYPEKYYKLFCK